MNQHKIQTLREELKKKLEGITNATGGGSESYKNLIRDRVEEYIAVIDEYVIELLGEDEPVIVDKDATPVDIMKMARNTFRTDIKLKAGLIDKASVNREVQPKI